MITFSKLQFFYQNYSPTLKPIVFVIWSHRSWRLLHCHGNGCSW